jgi:uncharacterized membrane protein YdjX (TVP38/TMEM64 family)
MNLPPDTRRLRRGALWTAALLALVIVPFWLFGDRVEALVADILRRETGRLLLAGFGVLALAADVLLPVPSSVIATALGALLGGATGTVLSAAGLTLGCGLGYWLGRRAGESFASRRRDPADPLIASLLERHGVIVLVLCRGVPVLAEASVIAAGVLGMPAPRFFLATTLANIGVGGAYAALGTTALTGSPAAAFLAAALLPALLLGLFAAVRGRIVG